MSRENLDLVQSIYAAWERGDFRSADSAHPEIPVVVAEGPEATTWTGLAEMAQGWRDYLGKWEEYRVEAEEYRELNDERVLVFIHLHGRGKTSGLDVERMGAKGANVWHLRDGKATRLVLYFDRQRALADLGLASEAGSQDS